VLIFHLAVIILSATGCTAKEHYFNSLQDDFDPLKFVDPLIGSMNGGSAMSSKIVARFC
jgi:hypothetical protein